MRKAKFGLFFLYIYLIFLVKIFVSCDHGIIERGTTRYFVYVNTTAHEITYNFNPFPEQLNLKTISLKPYDTLAVVTGYSLQPEYYEFYCMPFNYNFKDGFYLPDSTTNVVIYDGIRCDTFTEENKLNFRITDPENYECKELTKFSIGYYFYYTEEDYENTGFCN